MRNRFAPVENLRKAAAETARLRDIATDVAKREFYARIYDNLNRSADEVEQVMNALTGPKEDTQVKIASTNTTAGHDLEK